jgi:hypothetical protein
MNMSHRAQEQTLESLRLGQQALTDTVAAWVKPVLQVVPTGPSVSLPTGVPTSQEVVGEAFAFTLRVVEAQRAFALDLLNAVSPVMRKLTGHADRAAVGPAT